MDGAVTGPHPPAPSVTAVEWTKPAESRAGPSCFLAPFGVGAPCRSAIERPVAANPAASARPAGLGRISPRPQPAIAGTLRYPARGAALPRACGMSTRGTGPPPGADGGRPTATRADGRTRATG